MEEKHNSNPNFWDFCSAFSAFAEIQWIGKTMIHCVWCGESMDSFLTHICPDGADFQTRSQWSLEGKKAKYVIQPDHLRSKEPIERGKTYLRLTESDKEFLKGMKISID